MMNPTGIWSAITLSISISLKFLSYCYQNVSTTNGLNYKQRNQIVTVLCQKNYVMRVSIYLKAEINIYQRNVLDHQLSFAKVSTKGWRHCQNLWPDTFNCDDTLRIKASSSIIFYGVGGHTLSGTLDYFFNHSLS